MLEVGSEVGFALSLPRPCSRSHSLWAEGRDGKGRQQKASVTCSDSGYPKLIVVMWSVLCAHNKLLS